MGAGTDGLGTPAFDSLCGVGFLSSIRFSVSLNSVSSSFGVLVMEKTFDVATDLRQFPEIAEFLGYYAASFSGMELTLWLLYGHILGMDENEAMVLLGSLQSFTLKHDAVSRIFERRRATYKDADEIAAALSEAKLVNAARNKFMHGLYLTDATYSEVRLLPFATDSTRLPKAQSQMRFIQVSVESIREEIQRIDSVHRRLSTITSKTRVETGS